MWFAHLWLPLWEIQSQAKTNLFTVGCFSTRQSHLCHGPGSNTSENTKKRLSKASCHLPTVAETPFSSRNCQLKVWQHSLIWKCMASPHVNCTTKSSAKFLLLWFGQAVQLIATARALCLYLLKCQQSTCSCYATEASALQCFHCKYYHSPNTAHQLVLNFLQAFNISHYGYCDRYQPQLITTARPF